MNDLQIAAYLRRFMLVNKRYYFSKAELEYVAEIVLSSYNIPKSRLTAKRVNKVLEDHGIVGVWQKHSKSERHKLWNRGGLDRTTLKLKCSV